MTVSSMRGLLATPEVYRVVSALRRSAASSAGIFSKSLCSGCAAVRCETLGQAKLITEYILALRVHSYLSNLVSLIRFQIVRTERLVSIV